MWVKVSIIFACIRGNLSICVGAPLIRPIHLSNDEQAQSQVKDMMENRVELS